MVYTGKLHKKKDHWVVRYKMEDDLCATDGGELSIHPDTPIEIFAELTENWKDNLQGKEIEFEMVNYIHDTVVAKILYDYPLPNEQLYEDKANYDEYMDGKNQDTWFDELDINHHWKKCLKKYDLSPEVWNVIARLYYGENVALKESLEEQMFYRTKYFALKRKIKDLVE